LILNEMDLELRARIYDGDMIVKAVSHSTVVSRNIRVLTLPA
jgi:hypothetical protein